MRISQRLAINAVTSYLRLGTTFLIGVFLTWYVVGQVGLVGLGMIALSTSTFGFSAAIEQAIRQSLVREIAQAITSGDQAAIGRTLTSAVVYCSIAAGAILLLYLALAGVAMTGFFRTEGLDRALALMFLAEAGVTGVRMLAAPYTQSIFAAQRVALDNGLMIAQRLAGAAAAVVAFHFVFADESLAARLVGFAGLRVVFAGVELGIEVLIARSLLSGLRFSLRSFDRAEFRSIAGTVWHAGQFSLLGGVHVHMMAVIINLLFGMTFNGVWQVVTQVGGHARMVADGVLRGIDPLATSMAASGRRAAIVDLMARGLRYQLLAVLPFAAVYIAFLLPIVGLWVGGRLEADPAGDEAALAPAEALRLIALLGAINIAAEVVRVSTRGIERMLFGTGEVRSYSWFAKYAAAAALTLSITLMWATDSIVWAPIVLLVVNFAYSVIVIPLAARRRAGLELLPMLKAALPRAVTVMGLTLLAVLPLRRQLEDMSLGGLALLGVVAAVAFGLASFLIGLESGERRLVVGGIRRTLGVLKGRGRTKATDI